MRKILSSINNNHFSFFIILNLTIITSLLSIEDNNLNPRLSYTTKPLSLLSDHDREKIEEALIKEHVVSLTKIADYLTQQGKVCDADNEVYVALLKSGLKAIFKPGEDRYAEVVAYRASTFLGLTFVPPTVLRTIDKIPGSLQLFVDSPIDLYKDAAIYNKIDTQEIRTMKLFYFVFGQWDMHKGNQLIELSNKQPHLVLIDNAGMTNKQQVQYGDFAFVCLAWSNKRNDDFTVPFPFDQPQTLSQPSLEELERIFDEFMPNENIKRFWQRHKRITYCIWHNALWIQFYKDNPDYTPNYVPLPDSALLARYKKLTKEIIEEFWKEALETEDKQHFHQLIGLTLERLEQVLQASKEK
jgi:hypothetical protein